MRVPHQLRVLCHQNRPQTGASGQQMTTYANASTARNALAATRHAAWPTSASFAGPCHMVPGTAPFCSQPGTGLRPPPRLRRRNRKTTWPEHLSAATMCPLIGDKPCRPPLWPDLAAYIAMCIIPPDENCTHTPQHTIVISTHKALQEPRQP